MVEGNFSGVKEGSRELPWRKLLDRGGGDSTQTSAERAVGGGLVSGPDVAAAAAFAALLDAETRRSELAAKTQGQEKAPASPAAGGSWRESVVGRPAEALGQAV